MGKRELLAFEAIADSYASSLSVLQLPIRATYSALTGIASALRTGPFARRLATSNLMARLSYLVDLLARCPAEPIGESAHNALEAYHSYDADSSQTRFLISYAHFSELMPQVRRDYYEIVCNDAGFELKHKTHDFADQEVRDTLMSELSLPHMATSASIAPLRRTLLDAGMDAVRTGLPLSDAVIAHLFSLTNGYEQLLRETSLMGEAGFITITGHGQKSFVRLQAVLIAFADYAVILRTAMTKIGTESSLAEAFEWAAVCWKEDPFLGLIQAIGGENVSADSIDRTLEYFSIDFRVTSPNVAHAGDGFLPPILRLPGVILTNVDFLGMTVQSRNLLYALHKRDPKTFDNVVSQQLEPHLVEQCAKILRALPNVKVCTNVNWSNGDVRGEIDLVAYDSVQNVVLQGQAKAPLPPQGARLVQRMEDRVREGLKQLSSFRKTGAAFREQRLAQAFGTNVASSELLDAIVVRSSIGTLGAIEGATDVRYLTLPLLALVARRALDSGKRCTLRDVVEDANAYMNDLVLKAKPYWTSENLTILDKTLKIPMLQYDEHLIDGERAIAFDAQRSFEAI